MDISNFVLFSAYKQIKQIKIAYFYTIANFFSLL